MASVGMGRAPVPRIQGTRAEALSQRGIFSPPQADNHDAGSSSRTHAQGEP